MFCIEMMNAKKYEALFCTENINAQIYEAKK